MSEREPTVIECDVCGAEGELQEGVFEAIPVGWHNVWVCACERCTFRDKDGRSVLNVVPGPTPLPPEVHEAMDEGRRIIAEYKNDVVEAMADD
jgi:C4-type Zn-finger protein